jgi:hypothetical protein
MVAATTSMFMKKSLAEFARCKKLESRKIAQWSRNKVDAAIQGSCDIYADSMARVKYNREHPADSAVVKLIEEAEVDCEVGEAEEEDDKFGVDPFVELPQAQAKN